MKEPPASASNLSMKSKTQKAAVRRTNFQVRSEAHDTYTMLPCVFIPRQSPGPEVQIRFSRRNKISVSVQRYEMQMNKVAENSISQSST